jgi:hypothetical protein
MCIQFEDVVDWLQLNLNSDFQDKETRLMVYGKQMGVTVDSTPKCHPEMAGEGIGYTWAGSKQSCRSSPLTLRRNKKGFHVLVRQFWMGKR